MRARSENSVRVLLRIPAFRRLWGAITVSSFGDWMGLLATTSLAAYLTQRLVRRSPRARRSPACCSPGWRPT